LKCAFLKVSSSIPSGGNLGGEVHIDWASTYRVLLWLRMGSLQVGGEIGPIGLVSVIRLDTEFFKKNLNIKNI